MQTLTHPTPADHPAERGMSPVRLRAQRGMSLAEMLVASAVFVLVILAAYQVFQRSNEEYQKGQNQAEMVQNARVAFDEMVNDIRQAGYEFDVDGELTTYPNQPDEPLEYMHFRALILRANYDFDKELKGREAGLEQPDTALCCPVVTTANDEIVGYALGKPQGTTQPTGTITARFDTSGTLDDGDTDYRDAFVVKTGGTAGTIENEENISVSGFELGALNSPPYTLYRFTFNENGTVNKQPLIDNVRNLEFTYYNDADAVVVGRVDSSTVTNGTQAEWGDDNGQDKQAGRLTRWGIRRVKVLVQTMTPERDLRLVRANSATGADPNNWEGHRLFRLEEDIVPPNFGRRGQTDRDILPPEPVRNVEVCTGECGFVRVSWEPGPPEDKVTDHIIILCDGPCSDTDFSNRIGSFLMIANYDSTTDPDREYVTLTKEDDSEIQDGVEIWARVIARNAAGTESECPVSDCAECCASLTGEVVATETRMEAFSGGSSTGYDPADPDWPNAKADNSAAALIVTNTLSSYYPAPNEITVTVSSPQYVLNRASAAGAAPNNWTTKTLGTDGAAAALDCHREESTPNDASDDPALRTKFENVTRDTEKLTVYVFRVSGSDDWNWGDGVTDPRNFIPGPDNLYDFEPVPLTNESVSYPDRAVHEFVEVGGSTDQYDDRFTGTKTNTVNPSGGSRPIAQPPTALTPGEVYYYRFRAVDVCWEDKYDPDASPQPLIPNGVHDAFAIRKAWAVAKDFANNNQWRDNSMSISPFYPPLLDVGDATGDRDRPDQGTHDSDDYPDTPNPIDAFALPGYAIPATTLDGLSYVKPEKPTEFYIAKSNDTNTALIDEGNASKHDARLVFNSAKRSAPVEVGVDPMPATYTQYRLYRKRATSMNPPGAEMAFAVGSATELVQVRTKGQQALYHLTIDGAARGGPTAAANANGGDSTYTQLRDIGTLEYPGDCPDAGQNDGVNCFPYIYRLATVQCTDSVLNDGIDTSSGEESDLSRPFLFPCQFYDQVEDIDMDPTVATGATSVVATVTMQDAAGLADPGCDGDPADPNDTELKSARLLAYYGSGDFADDWIGTSDWQATVAGSCEITFGQAAIDKARREFAGSIRYVAEVSDQANSAAAASDTNSVGCRVRSDMPGPGADFGVETIACAEECGGDGGTANVFRGVGGGAPNISAEVLDADPNTIRVTIPKVDACTSTAFTLYELEFAFVHVGSASIPDFSSATVVDGLVGGSRDLEDPSITGDYGDGDADESDLFGGDSNMRLRWYQSFCESGGTCSYPKVRAGSDELVVDITFDGAACDLKLTEFNFRVAADFDDDGTADEMLCTRRGETGAAADPQPPTGAGQINPGPGGSGRGPMGGPVEACVTCEDTCEPCDCPVNNTDADIAMDDDPTYSPVADPSDGGPGEKLILEFTQQGCTADCNFTLTNFVLDIGCQPDKDCDPDSPGYDPLPKIEQGAARFKLVRSDVTLDMPEPDFAEESDAAFHQYKWSNMSGIEILPGETFQIEVLFLGDMTNTEIRDIRLDFGSPLEFECDGNGDPGSGPAPCNMVSGTPLPID